MWRRMCDGGVTDTVTVFVPDPYNNQRVGGAHEQ